jgi:hypothetical protein
LALGAAARDFVAVVPDAVPRAVGFLRPDAEPDLRAVPAALFVRAADLLAVAFLATVFFLAAVFLTAPFAREPADLEVVDLLLAGFFAALMGAGR